MVMVGFVSAELTRPRLSAESDLAAELLASTTSFKMLYASGIETPGHEGA